MLFSSKNGSPWPCLLACCMPVPEGGPAEKESYHTPGACQTALGDPGGLEQGQRKLPEADDPGGNVGDEPAELRPKGPAMALDAGVDELVEDDVIGEVGRQDGERALSWMHPELVALPKAWPAPDAQPAGREPVLPGQRVQRPARRARAARRSRHAAASTASRHRSRALAMRAWAPRIQIRLLKAIRRASSNEVGRGSCDSHAPRCADGQADAAARRFFTNRTGPTPSTSRTRAGSVFVIERSARTCY